MPRFNSLGLATTGYQRCWFDNTRTIFQDCSSGICRVVLSDGTIVVTRGDVAYVYANGQGRYVVFHAPENADDTPEVLGNDWEIEGAGLDRALDPVGPDGSVCYKARYFSAGPWKIRNADGSDGGTIPGDCHFVQNLGGGRVLWTEKDVLHSTFGFTYDGTKLWWPRFVDGHFLFQSAETSQLVLDGHVLGPAGNYFRPDLTVINGVIHVAWAEDEGETQLRPLNTKGEFEPLKLTPSELAQLPPFGAPSSDGTGGTPQPPKERPVITVNKYADVLVKGVDCQLLDMEVGSTRIVITKDAADNLSVSAQNSEGSDHTSVTRHVDVVGPEASRPVRSDRFWFGPNIASTDMVKLFTTPDAWAQARDHVGVLSLYAQNISDPAPSSVGPNTWQVIQASGIFDRLREWNIPLAIEMGSVKDFDCDAKGALIGSRDIITRIRAAGGEVAYISMDEPITYGLQACNRTEEQLYQVADAVAAFMKQANGLGVPVGWLEAWPAVPIETQRKFLILLQERGVTPAYWHLDIDWRRAKKEKKSFEDMIKTARQYASELVVTKAGLEQRRDIKLGVFLAGYPHPTDAEYAADVRAMAERVQKAIPDLDHVCVQSWVPRVEGALQDEPLNLPETAPSSHTAILNSVVEIFSK